MINCFCLSVLFKPLLLCWVVFEYSLSFSCKYRCQKLRCPVQFLKSTFCDVNFEAFFKAYRKWHNHEGRPFQWAYARSHATKTHSATQLDTWRDRESSNALNGVSIFCNRSTKMRLQEQDIHSFILSCFHAFCIFCKCFYFLTGTSPFLSLSLTDYYYTHTHKN